MQYKVNTTKWKCLDIFKDDIVVKDDNFIFQVQCYIYLYFVLLCDFFYIYVYLIIIKYILVHITRIQNYIHSDDLKIFYCKYIIYNIQWVWTVLLTYYFLSLYCTKTNVYMIIVLWCIIYKLYCNQIMLIKLYFETWHLLPGHGQCIFFS